MGLSENWGALFWGPYNKDPTIEGTILGSPIFGNPHVALCDPPGPARCELRAAIGGPSATAMTHDPEILKQCRLLRAHHVPFSSRKGFRKPRVKTLKPL